MSLRAMTERNEARERAASLQRQLSEARAERNNLRAAALMAKTRLDDFADKANAGQVHYSARELKRKIGAAFADFDAVLANGHG